MEIEDNGFSLFHVKVCLICNIFRGLACRVAFLWNSEGFTRQRTKSSLSYLILSLYVNERKIKGMVNKGNYKCITCFFFSLSFNHLLLSDVFNNVCGNTRILN